MIFYISRTRDDDAKPCDEATGDGDDWVIDVQDLDALIALAVREGAPLVVTPKHSLTYPWLEIYDDYRE